MEINAKYSLDRYWVKSNNSYCCCRTSCRSVHWCFYSPHSVAVTRYLDTNPHTEQHDHRPAPHLPARLARPGAGAADAIHTPRRHRPQPLQVRVRGLRCGRRLPRQGRLGGNIWGGTKLSRYLLFLSLSLSDPGPSSLFCPLTLQTAVSKDQDIKI